MISQEVAEGDGCGAVDSDLPAPMLHRRSRTKSCDKISERSVSSSCFDEEEMRLTKSAQLFEHRLISSASCMKRRSSQAVFSEKEQTLVIFDWDDTLFPTTYILHDLGLSWKRPLHCQPSLRERDLRQVQERLAACEARALGVLKTGCSLARVIVITLAAASWVEQVCRNFFPKVGRFFKEQSIKIVYAREKMGAEQLDRSTDPHNTEEDLERFWGQLKGRAILEQAEVFYSQYEGQSWKNILSIGDSNFERYGLFAATTAYMLGDPKCASRSNLLDPAQQKCWEKVDDGHFKKLRVKCCKLMADPGVEELTSQLSLVNRWLEGMVKLDSGFDIDFEDFRTDTQVARFEALLHGKSPSTFWCLPLASLLECMSCLQFVSVTRVRSDTDPLRRAV